MSLSLSYSRRSSPANAGERTVLPLCICSRSRLPYSNSAERSAWFAIFLPGAFVSGRRLAASGCHIGNYATQVQPPHFSSLPVLCFSETGHLVAGRSIALATLFIQGNADVADLWRRGLEVTSILAACRDTHTLRQTLPGLLRCLLYDALRYLAQSLQSLRSCLVAPALHEQSTTWSVGNVRNQIGEVRNVLR